MFIDKTSVEDKWRDKFSYLIYVCTPIAMCAI